MSAPSTFDDTVASYRQWQEAPWGRLWYAIANECLDVHLTGTPERVLDVGSGNGLQASRFAERGSEVTLVNLSAAMLDDARQLLADRKISDNVTFVQADALDTESIRALGQFDLVLCHNVIHHVDDPQRLVSNLVGAVSPGGLISLTGLNAHSEPLRHAIHSVDPDRARSALETANAHTATFSRTVRLWTAEAATDLLTPHGFEVLGQYGIRVVSDYISDDARKSDPDFFAKLLALELQLAGRQPFASIGRFFNVIAMMPA